MTNRELISAWMSPEGKFHVIPDGVTHGDWIRNRTSLGTWGEAISEGWIMIHELATDSEETEIGIAGLTNSIEKLKSDIVNEFKNSSTVRLDVYNQIPGGLEYTAPNLCMTTEELLDESLTTYVWKNRILSSKHPITFKFQETRVRAYRRRA